MLIVQKYGGTSVADPACIHRAAARSAQLYREGARVVTVVSAQGDTTDLLLKKAMEISPEASGREMDAYLSAGEQLSAALMAMAVEAQGVPAVSLTGWQAGIRTNSVFGNARVLRVDAGRLTEELDAGRVVVVAGFQGLDPLGNITTLGRGGSDTTAVALAAALKADECRIYTDVDGVYDRDPRKTPNARRFDRIGYDDMLNLARGGAQVLHDRCVELAKQTGTRLTVCSAFSDTPGTLVGD